MENLLHFVCKKKVCSDKVLESVVNRKIAQQVI